jgi:hypothetical protein
MSEFLNLKNKFPQLIEWMENYQKQPSAKAAKVEIERPEILHYRYRLVDEQGYTVRQFSSWFYSLVHAIDEGRACLRERKSNAFLLLDQKKMAAPSQEDIMVWILAHMIGEDMTEKAKTGCEACRIDSPGQQDHMENGCLMYFEEKLFKYFDQSVAAVKSVAEDAVGKFSAVCCILGLDGRQEYEADKAFAESLIEGDKVREYCEGLKDSEGLPAAPLEVLLDSAWQKFDTEHVVCVE